MRRGAIAKCPPEKQEEEGQEQGAGEEQQAGSDVENEDDRLPVPHLEDPADLREQHPKHECHGGGREDGGELLVRREPEGDGLDGGGEVAALAEAQRLGFARVGVLGTSRKFSPSYFSRLQSCRTANDCRMAST